MCLFLIQAVDWPVIDLVKLLVKRRKVNNADKTRRTAQRIIAESPGDLFRWKFGIV
jgi:hypothetical protein